MLEYRIYLLKADGHVRVAEGVVCESDDEACAYARSVDNGAESVEVWRGAHRIAVIAPGRDPHR